MYLRSLRQLDERETMKYLERLFEYDHWANLAALASLATIPPGHAGGKRALIAMNHVVGAQRVWLARFEQPQPVSAQPWPDLSLEECRNEVHEMHQAWKKILAGGSKHQLPGALAYRNTKGVEYKNQVEDILTHLVLHSAYHRGQVAMAVRDAGGTPAVTDYVLYVRQAQGAAH